MESRCELKKQNEQYLNIQSLTITLKDKHRHGVRATLSGHKGQVTTVKLLEDTAGDSFFVSGDTTGEIRIWKCNLPGVVS